MHQFPDAAGLPYRAPPDETRPEAPVLRRARPDPRPFRPIELGAALGLVAVAEVALWATEPGESVPAAPGGFGLGLFFLAVPAALAGVSGLKYRSKRLYAVAAMLAAVAVRAAIDPRSGAIVAGLGLIGAFALALRVRRLFVPDAIVAAGAALARFPSRVRSFGSGLRRVAQRTRIGRVSVLPIVIPAALLLVFGGVFALANPVVAHGALTLWGALCGVIRLPSVAHIAFWTATLGAGLWLLRPTCRRPRGTELAVPANLGEAGATLLLVTRNALIGQNVLFFAYNALDARYLWAGSPPAGMATQQYAHAGAFWLTVALLLLTLVIGFMFKGPLAHDPVAKSTRTLAYAWMAQGIVLALGTYRRIAIHVARSGLSDLRIVGILGTTLVVFGVVLVAWKLRHGRTFLWVLRRQLDALAVTAVFYVVFPTHLVSARVNVARVSHGEYRPILHAFRQSQETESAAELLPLLDHPDPRIRQGVAALLDGERKNLRAEVDQQRTWRARDVASTAALRALDGAEDRIATALGSADPHDARLELLGLTRAVNAE